MVKRNARSGTGSVPVPSMVELRGVAGPGSGGELAARSDGPIYVVMRLYWSKAEALNGSWKPPAVQRTQ